MELIVKEVTNLELYETCILSLDLGWPWMD